jgi:hypothetical protein
VIQRRRARVVEAAVQPHVHIGQLQIAPRLTPSGLGYNYPDRVLLSSLAVADLFALRTVVECADTAGNATLRTAAMPSSSPVGCGRTSLDRTPG